MLQKAVAVLPAINVREAIEFYESKLGFKGMHFGTYGIVKLKEVEIHICLSDKKPFLSAGCFIWVDNIEDTFAELSSKDMIAANEKLTTKPLGLRQFVVKDNNNNVLYFGERK